MVRRALVLLAALAVSLILLAPNRGSADGDEIVATGFSGELPASGVALTLWDGGPVADIAIEYPAVGSVWVSASGSLVGYIVGAPDFSNAAFLDLYSGGEVPGGTPMLVVVVEGPPSAGPPPIVGEKNTYSQEAYDLYYDLGLSFSERAVVRQWTSDFITYMPYGTPEDRAWVEAVLTRVHDRLGIGYTFTSAQSEANLEVFVGFDRFEPPPDVLSARPHWANDLLTRSAFADFEVVPDDGGNSSLIVHGWILVPVQNTTGNAFSQAWKNEGFLHELAHVLIAGRGHSEDMADVLYPIGLGTKSDYSPAEWEAFELAYDENVEPGMRPEDVLDVINIGD